jgi:hypothetical protein
LVGCVTVAITVGAAECIAIGGTAPVETIPSGTSGAPIIIAGGVPTDEAKEKEKPSKLNNQVNTNKSLTTNSRRSRIF